MFNRITVNTLLKSAIGLLAGALIVVLALGAWQSWNRLAAATRIAHVIEASGHLFKALHLLRSERAPTVRELNSDQQAASIDLQVKEYREALNTAFKLGLAALETAEFPGRQEAVAALNQAVSKHTALQQESAAAFLQPKAARRQGLVKEYFDAGTAVLVNLDKTSLLMTKSVALEDAYIDQLLAMKQLAWIARNAGGDASGLIVNTIGGVPLPSDPLLKYSVNIGKLEVTWRTLEDMATNLSLPPRLTAAIEKGRQGFLGSEDTAFRMQILKGLIAGEKATITPRELSLKSSPVLATLVGAAEGALDIAKDHSAGQRSKALWQLSVQLILLLVAVLFGVSLMLIVSLRIIAPLQMIKDFMLKVAGGDFTDSLPRLAREDEVGQIIMSVNSMVDEVRTTISGIKVSAREVTNASTEIATTTTDLSQRTEEQAASLEQTSASMEEISSTVKKNAENAQHASISAGATKDVADRGGQVVAKAVEAMAKIEESSRKISDIIGVIDEIARQTNLLALNAAVEAARAGEAGRGFAVVASEVRSLAQRSSQAAKDIKDLITNSNGQVKDGVDLVNRAGVALTEIVESIKTVADIVAGIATASAEQSTGIDEINKALTQMDGVTQQNSALVEENAATAKTLEFQAKSMDEQVAFFQVDGNSITAGQPNRSHDSAPAPRRTAARHARAA